MKDILKPWFKSDFFSQVKAFISKSCLSLSLKTLRAFSFCEPVPSDQLCPVNNSKYRFVPGKTSFRVNVQIIQKLCFVHRRKWGY